jgi:hypothetical protein
VKFAPSIAALTILIACGGTAQRSDPARGERPPLGAPMDDTCDPIGDFVVVEPPPGEPRCGDGVAAAHQSCVRDCERGCGFDSCSREVRCATQLEACDGDDLSGASCAASGFPGGAAIPCTDECTFGVASCSICRPGDPSARCVELAPSTESTVLIASTRETLLLARSSASVTASRIGRDLSLETVYESPDLRTAVVGTRRGFLIASAGQDANALFSVLHLAHGARESVVRHTVSQPFVRSARWLATSEGKHLLLLEWLNGWDALQFDADGSQIPMRRSILRAVSSGDRVLVIDLPAGAALTLNDDRAIGQTLTYPSRVLLSVSVESGYQRARIWAWATSPAFDESIGVDATLTIDTVGRVRMRLEPEEWIDEVIPLRGRRSIYRGSTRVPDRREELTSHLALPSGPGVMSHTYLTATRAFGAELVTIDVRTRVPWREGWIDSMRSALISRSL